MRCFHCGHAQGEHELGRGVHSCLHDDCRCLGFDPAHDGEPVTVRLHGLAARLSAHAVVQIDVHSESDGTSSLHVDVDGRPYARYDGFASRAEAERTAGDLRSMLATLGARRPPPGAAS
jgi:hypothetical protein